MPMPRARLAFRTLAALLVLTLVGLPGAQAQEPAPSAPDQTGPAGSGGPAGNDDDDAPPRPAPVREGRPDREERQDRERRQDPVEHKGFGQSRSLDPFEAEEEVQRALAARRPVVAANPDHDVLVCVAGCDGPPGKVIGKQKKRAAGSLE